MFIKSNVAARMKAAGATIHGLAEKTGLSSQTILRARSEKIRLCRLETLGTIAAGLGVRVKDLFEEE
jgi:DNA-binding Xre family transcriptional regulator